jgi:hypothetical protein
VRRFLLGVKQLIRPLSESSSFSVIATSQDDQVAYGFMATNSFPSPAIATDANARGNWLAWLQQNFAAPTELQVI